MSGRKELAAGTTIYKTDLEQIRIGREKGRGGSAIVYDGQRISAGKSEFCLIKEAFPISKAVFRDENDTIQAADDTGKGLYQRVLRACESEVSNHAKLVGNNAPRNDTMLRASEYISPEMSENGNAYLILDTVECKTLADIKDFSVYKACEYIEKLLAAVSYIHQKGALHLDIAPDNIIIAETTDVVRLIDFNSSCFKDETTGLYHSGSSKKGFSASEVRDGFLKNICYASDLFSVAAVLYTMVFGELYKDIENSRRQVSAIRRKIIEKLDNVISKPAQRLLAEILCKGVAHYASDRYQTAEEMLTSIKELTELTAPTVVYPLDFSTHTRSLLPSFCQERNSMLEAVHQKLEEHNHVFIGGIGGSGKSALSAMFVNKFSSEYDAVQTISFTSCKDVIKAVGFAGISDNDSYYKEHPDDLYCAKLHALQTKTDSRTLLIIENYIQGKDDQYDDLMKCPCCIIFNTRNAATNDCKDAFLPLNDISEEEALEYFLKVSERENETETIKMIIPFTGRNFLLMKLLALKLRNSPNVSAEFVLNKLQSNERFDKGRFSFDKFNEETQEEILREVFNISDLSSEEIEILSAMTLVPYCGIKQADFEQALKLDIEENPIDDLVRLGWITRTGKGTDVKISLHQTISDFFARSEETKPDFDKFAPLLEEMSEVFGIGNAETLAERDEIFSVSDFFARRVTGNNLACADIYELIGKNYNNGAKYRKALEYYNRALKIRQLIQNENSLDTAVCYNEIGRVYNRLGDFDKALKYFNMAFKIRLSVLGESDPDTAASYNNIGCVYDSLGNYDKALEHYNTTLKINLSVLGENHPHTATSYNNIGYVYDRLGNYDRALEYFNTALKIKLSVLGENHPSTATSYNNIGFSYKNLDHYDKALEYYNMALKIKLLVLGENHSSTAISYNNIGYIYKSLGDYGKALEYYNAALKIRLAVLGEKNLDTATSYNNIGCVYYSLSDYDKALEYCGTALKIWQLVLGENHPTTISCHDNIEIIKSILKQ